MKNLNTKKLRKYSIGAAIMIIGSFTGILYSQDKLPQMPGYDQYQKMNPQIRGSVKMGSLYVTWKEDGSAFEYQKDGKLYLYDLSTQETKEMGETTGPPPRSGRFRSRSGMPARGRQFPSAVSPDSTLKAFYLDRNLWISDRDGNNEMAVTTEGNEKDRIKYGTASWVYGEELFQRDAMWWSPDGKKIAFYRFDESKVKDYYLQYDQTRIQDSMDIEPYVKVGGVNPVVDIYIYDLSTEKTIRVDVRDGKPFDNSVTGHYIYGISWSPDGSEILFHRTNRRQNIMEYTAADPETGKCRVVVHEEWLPSFTENTPQMQFLEDGKRFIWTSERTGWRNLYLYDLSGELLVTLTDHQFEVSNIVRIDEGAGFLYYMARDGDNHMKMQLHRVGLDGTGDIRLTDPAFNHRVDVSPDGKYFIDIAQTHDIPPVTYLVDDHGNIVDELATSDMSKFNELGLKPVELFTFTSADGKTELHGMLHFPSGFDKSKKYPLLISVYGGPSTNGARETFSVPNSFTEYGFLVASFDARSAAGRGKRFLDVLYGHLGIVEMDDLAEGVKSLYDRPYFDKNRVGIFGTSYGGTSAATCLLRFPDVFHAACANSAVTDFRNYDNIYTERYMGLLEDNVEGYDAGSIMTYAENLKGDLMIYYGTADNNVHPSNSLQLIQALQKEGKSFEVQVGPDRGHTSVNRDRMMEFFIENLVLK